MAFCSRKERAFDQEADGDWSAGTLTKDIVLLHATLLTARSCISTQIENVDRCELFGQTFSHAIIRVSVEPSAIRNKSYYTSFL